VTPALVTVQEQVQGGLAGLMTWNTAVSVAVSLGVTA